MAISENVSDTSAISSSSAMKTTVDHQHHLWVIRSEDDETFVAQEHTSLFCHALHFTDNFNAPTSRS
ncbi:MAG: hypothetical protein ACI92E_000124 [Oceanicoccus sp.]|jgi:hypothetical protein